MQKWLERIFSNRNLGKRVCIGIEMIMMLGQKFCHFEKSIC